MVFKGSQSVAKVPEFAVYRGHSTVLGQGN